MQKRNRIFVATITILTAMVLSTKSVGASTIISIQSLPSYVNTNTFKLSCTSNGTSALFYVSKHGGPFNSFGGSIDLTTNQCITQVTSAQIDEQTDYKFKVVVDGTESSEISTIYDASGPSPVSGFSKERINDGEYKLRWKNPNDTDFDKVVIYRAQETGFSADGAHEIARVSGGPDSEMTYTDHFTPDASKNNYYLIRALDHANNSSGLAGDGGTTTYTETIDTQTNTPATKITTIPLSKEKTSGSVLGTESEIGETVTLEPTQAQTNVLEVKENPIKWILTHKKISLTVLIGLGIVGFAVYKLLQRKNR